MTGTARAGEGTVLVLAWPAGRCPFLVPALVLGLGAARHWPGLGMSPRKRRCRLAGFGVLRAQPEQKLGWEHAVKAPPSGLRY